jgi:uncharacterized membrane protein YkoI
MLPHSQINACPGGIDPGVNITWLSYVRRFRSSRSARALADWRGSSRLNEVANDRDEEIKMSTTKKARNRQARVALLAALALLFGGSVGVAGLRAQGAGKSHVEAEQQAKYKSSIQVPNDDKGEREEAGEGDEKGEKAEGNEANEANEAGEQNEADEQNEATSPEEQAEAARYQKLARITADQARSAALAAVPGTAMSVELENEDGNLVYGVTVKAAAGERDVKVDAGNGKVLHIEQDGQD